MNDQELLHTNPTTTIQDTPTLDDDDVQNNNNDENENENENDDEMDNPELDNNNTPPVRGILRRPGEKREKKESNFKLVDSDSEHHSESGGALSDSSGGGGPQRRKIVRQGTAHRKRPAGSPIVNRANEIPSDSESPLISRQAPKIESNNNNLNHNLNHNNHEAGGVNNNNLIMIVLPKNAKRSSTFREKKSAANSIIDCFPGPETAVKKTFYYFRIALASWSGWIDASAFS